MGLKIKDCPGLIDPAVGQPIFMVKLPDWAGEFFSIVSQFVSALLLFIFSFPVLRQVMKTLICKSPLSCLPGEFYKHYKKHA